MPSNNHILHIEELMNNALGKKRRAQQWKGRIRWRSGCPQLIERGQI
ncbi:hypothetical protein SD78_0240 [Bacillus badius]|nr:hypothetical protein SD78_0240 [Bacillus badius]